MIGLNCKLYINTGSRGSPTWTAVKTARDLKSNDTRKKGDSSSRESGFASATIGQREVAISGELLYKPAETGYAALKTAYEAGTIADIFLCDAPGGVGATGKRGDFYITDFSRTEPLNDSLVTSIALDLTFDGGHDLADYTYPGS